MHERGQTWIGRTWRRASLVQRLAIVSLLPTAITAVLLVILLTRHQIAALRDMARSTADAIATQAAAVAAEPLRAGDRRELRRIARSIGQLPHVGRVQILTRDGEILADVHGEDGVASANALTVRHEITDRDDASAVIGSVLVNVGIDDAIAAQRAGMLNALLWLGVALLVAALVSWQEARWISAPLRHLAGAIRRLGQGNRRVEVEVTDETEIGELQRGFNSAAAALYDIHRDMQREIEHATEELARKNAALEAASVAKARFLAAATHDLRQPLYALTLFSSALAVDEDDPERLDRIAHVQECIESLDHLFGELLDLSRLETGVMQPEFTDFALDGLFQEVSRNFRMIAEQHELRLITRTTDVWVHSDRTMLARILNNLVSNALRYTTRGGVLLGARRYGDGVRIDVWDTGCGIAPEHQARVFDEFYRVEQDDSRERTHSPPRGLGLGLATVQRLAQLLGSGLDLRSRPGRGTLFSIRVPAGRHRLSGSQPQRTDDAPPVSLEGRRVLVVDDEQAILAGVRFLLQGWGCDVRVAEDREQALLVAADWPEPPDMVISDLRLRQGHSGLDVLAALAVYYGTDPAAPPFARLLITGETDRERLRRTLESGIPLLYKPVAPEQLRQTMLAVLSMQPDPAPG